MADSDSMADDRLRRVNAFRSAFARSQAVRVAAVSGGFAVSDDRFPHSFEHNQLIVDAQPDVAAVLRLAPEHQQITVYDDALGRRCAEPLRSAGYRHSAELVMAHTGPVPAPGRAAEVELPALREAVLRQLRLWMPDARSR
jgi:hypothetical protein